MTTKGNSGRSLNEIREWRRTRYDSWPTHDVLISIADLDLLLAVADERDALSTPPADHVREALTKRLADEIEYRVRTAVALAKGGHSIAAQVTDGRASVPVILAQFEVRPPGTVNEAANERTAILADLREWSRPLGNSPEEDTLRLVIARIEARS